MNSIPHPEPWSEFWGIWLFYVFSYGLFLHLAMYLVGSLLLTAVLRLKAHAFPLEGYLRRFGAFMLILLFVSGIFNALWNCLIWGNLYVTFGADIENDFTPFLPLTQSDLVAQNGRLLTATMPQFQMIWLSFAAASWGCSFILYRFVLPFVGNPSLRQAPNEGDNHMTIPHSVIP